MPTRITDPAGAERNSDPDLRAPPRPSAQNHSSVAHTDLKGKAIRGGVITVASQSAQFVLYTFSTIILARFLSPEDYGLVGMVTACTGVLRVFKDAGLSTATVQRESISRDLLSTVFWINIVLGATIGLLSVALGPVLVMFYREPRLFAIAAALAGTFLFDALGAQHQALMRRQMRFKALACVEMTSQVIGLGTSVIMALRGFGYWALVANPLVAGFTAVLGVWIVEPWRPGMAKRRSGAGSMVRFGGYLTASSFLGYMFRNFDNVLIGWRWGAGPLGFYQKAYSLLLFPIMQINNPIGAVAVSALSRVASDPQRQRRYFVGGYTIATSFTLPIVVATTIFARDIIPFVLGSQWTASVDLFRLLAPAALIGAVLSPFGSLYVSSGRADRQLKASLVWTPVTILGFVAGLSYGARGVAIGYSIASVLMAVPICLYAIKGTPVQFGDVLEALQRPGLAALIAGAAGLVFSASAPSNMPSGWRAFGGCLLVLCVYALVLLKVMGQWSTYVEWAKYSLPANWFNMRGKPAAAAHSTNL